MRPLTCALCLSSCGSFVDSHVVPRAFYSEIRSQELIGKSRGKPERRYKKGIYGKFLCATCENQFQRIDFQAIKLIKQGQSRRHLYSSGRRQAFVIENAVNHQNVLHDFGLSLLWRASASGRDEFNKLNLGVYQEDLRKAFLAGCVPDSLRGKTGLLFQEFRNGTPEIDQSFEPYRLFKKSNEFKRLFGNFHCHVFGFPYGELLIRLGGDRPPNGYFDCQFDSFSVAQYFGQVVYPTRSPIGFLMPSRIKRWKNCCATPSIMSQLNYYLKRTRLASSKVENVQG
jgi:hypothetical protein